MSNPVAPQPELIPRHMASDLSIRPILPRHKAKLLSGPSWSIGLLAWLVRLSALINLVSCLLPDQLEVVRWLAPWVPFEISQGIRVRMFLTSLLLFILASGLARGKRTAWLLTMATLVVAPFLHLGHETIWPQTLINFGIILFLLFNHDHFVAGSDQQSVRMAVLLCSVLAITLLAFGTVRLHDLRFETAGGDDWEACTQTAFELVLVQHSETQEAETITSHDFFVFLSVGGLTIAVVGLFLTLRPVLLKRHVREEDLEKVQRLIDRYGQDPFDSYGLLDDKSYFFCADHQAVVPYVVSGKFAVALADPIGHPEARAMAIVDFALFCRQQDWEPVFYVINSEMAAVYQQAGFSLFKIGEGARLDPEQFHLKGSDFQNLRTLCNNARKVGVVFRWYDASQGIDEALEYQLASISERWLEAKKAREMSFDMGAYSLEGIRKNGAAVAIDESGNALAFATWRSFAQGTGRALDLMRSRPEARNIMDFVLVESIAHFRALGIRDVSLGVAPLANTTGGTTRLVAEERMVQFLFDNLNRIYGYKSLFEFKRKYRPRWNGRYVAYRRGVHLPLVGLALVRVHAPEGLWKFLFK